MVQVTQRKRDPNQRQFNQTGVAYDVLRRPAPTDAYYEWLEPVDGSGVKIYDQRRDVSELPNPPPGGFRGNRPEGYADYRPGYTYVSPWELHVPRTT